jgi:hypothetical protein
MSRLPFSIGSFPFAYAVTPETSNLTEFAVFTLSVIQLKALAFPCFLETLHFLGVTGVTVEAGRIRHRRASS